MAEIEWTPISGFEDICYEKSSEGIAKITINRPEVRNAFRPQTIQEMERAFADARDDSEVGVVILTGAGKEAFQEGGLMPHDRRCGAASRAPRIASLQGQWLGLLLKPDPARVASIGQAQQFRASVRVLPRGPHEAQHELLGLPASEPRTGTSDRRASIRQSQSPEVV